MENREFMVTSDLVATQGQRLGNYLIDMAVQYVIAMCLGLTVALIANLTDVYTLSDWMQSMNKLEEYLLGLLITIFYYGLTEMFLSRSIAKYITNTIVVMEDGSKPSSETIIKRTLCRLIPFDALSFLGNSSKGWHDSISDTYVVKKALLDQKKNLFYAFDEIGKTEE